ncbi:MAG TPA: hypothetical protein VGO11_18365 [Chthoniobacteraceae bacterium]|jgi:hypothetical protein|nr:hypothetical protein [Chthoniobacteraceae bacterium]
MPYDPTFPPTGADLISSEFRSQFTGIVDLIQTIPQGPQGVPGDSVTGAVVDGVSTVNPGEPATASASFASGTVHFSFAIPRGNDGTPGAAGGQGIQGIQGIQGDIGPVGPMFTSFNVNSTTTLDPGQPASVQTFFDGASIRFNFSIPRGADGLPGLTGQPGATGATGAVFTSFVIDSVTTLDPFAPATVSAVFDGTNVRFSFGIPRGFQGNNGNDGGPGPTGPQGAPGEVTLAQLNTAIANTSSNSNAVVQLPMPYADPDAEELRQKVNELIAALRK